MVVGVNGVSLWVKNESKTLALKSWHLAGVDHDFQSVESELRLIFGSERLFDLTFESKKCALTCPDATLVPRRLFSESDLSQYFKLLIRDQSNRVYGFEKLEEFDCYFVWATTPALLHLCRQYFAAENITHQAVSLLKGFRQLAPSEGYAVFANLRGQKVQIAVFERQNLVFFNAFDFAKPNDLLYFILLAYKQFELNPIEIPLTLGGTLVEDSDIFRLLLRYVRPMRFPPLPPDFQVPEAAKSLPAHYWYDLSLV